MTADTDRLARDIEKALRSLTEIPRLNPNGFIARPGFFERCRPLKPGWDERAPNARIYVDGFYGACRWNSWKVYTNALEDGLTLWLGFASWDARWTEHCWCMLGDRIVESTSSFHTYFGAQLNPDECKEFGNKFGTSDLMSRATLEVCTMQNGRRKVVPYDKTIYKESIGRERNPDTGAIKKGLGR